MISHLKSELAIMRMIKHENIVEIKDVFASQSKIFMVLEYLEGDSTDLTTTDTTADTDTSNSTTTTTDTTPSNNNNIGGELFDLIIGEKTLTERRACSYFNQLINGLQYCHDKGICHRDLKPENLLVSSAGVLKISDFGLSSIVDIKHNQLLDNAVGTPKYIAPEVIRRDRYDGKAADCWSVGVICPYSRLLSI